MSRGKRHAHCPSAEETLMNREDLLKKLAEDKLNHYEAIGLPPFKCRQLVNESMETWKKMSVEELEQQLGQGQY
jgi:hypothetical protein